ncbi:right-handed parallel beta-helix repeat-containing protein [Dyadobacter flavalbus]|uniref:Right-handed parallel beta-helix repeat-containing protein n=1 Tax=Dyadobacter flavalbus TaxID=2579942 RepID=A0A5M8QWZ5_9BACT|nr:right-handed parallel beta-helix repeat-containing protein [Dyadobacter flavalbus]
MTTWSTKFLCLVLVGILTLLSAHTNAIDPIRFSISTSAEEVSVNEEFEIKIKADLLNIPANTVYVFETARAFRLKVIFPDGFQQTGGSYHDFIEGELSGSKPTAFYTLRGKFVSAERAGVFQLLRSHKSANSASDFIEVDRLSFGMSEGVQEGSSNARIALAGKISYVPYLSMAELRSITDTATTVFITDPARAGIFKHNPSSTKADDGALTIVASGKRYERVFSGPVNVEWFGVVGDGATDHTATLQKMLDRADISSIYFPKPAVSYRIKNLNMRSNKTLTLEEGTVVEGFGTLGLEERMIMMYNVQNVSIKGNNVVFKDQKAKYTSGEQRHIFIMLGVKNVTIEGIAANNSGGDGFYIGSSPTQKFSENVKLINISADNNRRQGLSIISGKNIEVISPVFSNTNGTAPSAGIDIEPNYPDEFLEGIRITNPITKNNIGAGIVILIDDFKGTNRVVDIAITNHIDDGSFYGAYISRATGAITGTITFQNPIWKNNKANGFCASNYSSSACAVQINDPTVIDCNNAGSTHALFGSAMLVYREASAIGDANIGNVHIVRPKVYDTRSVKKMVSAFAFEDVSKKGTVKNCSLIDPAVLEGLDALKYVHMAVVDNFALSDRHEKLTFDIAQANRLLTYGFFKKVFHNATSTGLRTISLNGLPPNYPAITFEVRTGQILRLIPLINDTILPISATKGKYIQSNVVGSKITLRKIATNTWQVDGMVGTWTVQP